MKKIVNKNLIVFVLFFVVYLGNFAVTFSLLRKHRSHLLTEKILTEIDKNTSVDSQFFKSTGPLVLGEYTSTVQLGDSRSSNLKSFFRKHNSPLYDYTELIVKVSDQYKFDYRLLPAIAMQESNLCRHIPENSFNCWGWGIYGDQVLRFDSYAEAIETVAKGIKKEYIDKGLVTATAIMDKYTPSSQGSWAHGVNTFLQILE